MATKLVIIRNFVLLYILTFVVLLPLTCRNLRYSKYYTGGGDGETEEKQLLMVQENERLAKEALDNLADLPEEKEMTKTQESSVNVTFGVAIITAKRSASLSVNGQFYSPSYLTRVLEGIQLSLRNAKQRISNFQSKVIVCNANGENDLSEELKRLVSKVKIIHLKSGQKGASIFTKEKSDYANCLKLLMENVNSSYYIVFEDDALPKKAFFYTVTKIVNFWPRIQDDVMSVKLYHPETFLEYTTYPSFSRVVEAICVGILSGFLIALFHTLFINRDEEFQLQILIFVLAGIYFVALIECIGRVYFTEVRRSHWQFYSMVPSPGCCTPVMLFTKPGANIFSKCLTNKSYESEKLDFLLEKCAYDNWMTTWYIEPNLASHIGLISSLRHRALDPFKDAVTVHK